jgi:hypothetical protein
MRFLENLTKDVVVLDSLRSLIILAMIDIVMIDHKVDEVERHVFSRVAVLLGIDEEVARMELSRYEANHVVGHRFKEFEFCQMIDVIDADVSHRRTHSGSFTGGLNQSRHGNLSLGDSLVRGDAAAASEPSTVSANGNRRASSQHGIRSALQQYGDDDDDVHVENAALRKEIANLRKKLDRLSAELAEQEVLVVDA